MCHASTLDLSQQFIYSKSIWLFHLVLADSRSRKVASKKQTNIHNHFNSWLSLPNTIFLLTSRYYLTQPFKNDYLSMFKIMILQFDSIRGFHHNSFCKSHFLSGVADNLHCVQRRSHSVFPNRSWVLPQTLPLISLPDLHSGSSRWVLSFYRFLLKDLVAIRAHPILIYLLSLIIPQVFLVIDWFVCPCRLSVIYSTLRSPAYSPIRD